MKMTEFLQGISDEQGPLQGKAAEDMERMSAADFNELMEDVHGLICRGGEFHPTNRDNE